MQFFIDSQGTVVNLISSPVYQGSTNACELVLVAPFSASNIIEADFRLPNGMSTTPRIMTVQGQMQIEGRIYNVWRVLLDGVVTEYAGKVTVQFRIYQSGYNVGNDYYPVMPTSYASTFNVGKGVVPQIPDTPTPNVYKAILSYLSQLDPQYNVRSVIYSAPGNEIDTDTAIYDLQTIPPNAILKSNVVFSPSNVDGSTGQPVYALNEEREDNTGFTMLFVEPTEIGKMQITFSGIYWSVLLKVTATLEDDTSVDITDFRIRGTSEFNVIVAVNKTVKSLSIIQPFIPNEEYDIENFPENENKGFTQGRFYVDAIKMWHQASNGQVTVINSAFDTIVSFPDADYDAYVSQAEQARDEARASAQESANSAQESADSAQDALNVYNQLTEAPNTPGNVVVVNGQGFINTDLIPPIVKTDYYEVASKDDLVTLTQAQVGDIGYVLNEDGTALENSWILLAPPDEENAYATLANWKEQSTATAGSSAYAEQAGEAETANNVNGLVINGVLSEADYADLPSKQGVYFVSIEGGANGN